MQDTRDDAMGQVRLAACAAADDIRDEEIADPLVRVEAAALYVEVRS